MSVDTIDRTDGGHKPTDESADAPELVSGGAFDARSLITSLPQAARKLNPKDQARNPVMFVVFLGAIVTTVLAIWRPSWFSWLIAAWLWFTVIFANLAEAVAEGRGRAQADSLRKVKRDTMARRIGADGSTVSVSGSDLVVGDRIIVEAGEVIAGDGDVIEASRPSTSRRSPANPRRWFANPVGTDARSPVAPSCCRIASSSRSPRAGRDVRRPNDRARRGRRPQEDPQRDRAGHPAREPDGDLPARRRRGRSDAAVRRAEPDPIKLIALLVCLIPTTIGALLSSIGIAGMDRLVQRNVLAMSGRAVEPPATSTPC